jgi:hypothetical protein
LDKKLIERDLREEIAFWLQVQQDAHWRGGEVDLKIAEYAAKQRRRLQDELLNLWDGPTRRMFETHALFFSNEKQPTGVGAGELNTNITNSITDSLTQFGGMRNEYVS